MPETLIWVVFSYKICFHIFGIPSSSRHEKCCQIHQTLFGVFHRSRNSQRNGRILFCANVWPSYNRYDIPLKQYSLWNFHFFNQFVTSKKQKVICLVQLLWLSIMYDRNCSLNRKNIENRHFWNAKVGQPTLLLSGQYKTG